MTSVWMCRVRLFGIPTSSTWCSRPNAVSPNRTAVPIFGRPTDSVISAGKPIESKRPVSGSVPLGRSMAATRRLDSRTMRSRFPNLASIGRETLKPKTPSKTMSARRQKSATAEASYAPDASIVDTPAARAVAIRGSSSPRSKQSTTVTLAPARARYVAATMASPPLLPLPARTAMLDSATCCFRSDIVQSAIALPTSSIS